VTTDAIHDKTIRLRIEGMTCSSCVARVERALKSVAGVSDARVNLTTEAATIDVANDNLTSHQLVEAVRQAGYDAEKFRPDASALTGMERTQAARLQQHKQALVLAVGLGLPIIALEWLGPSLSSSLPGGWIGWRMLQALLCLMLLGSPAAAPIIVGGLRATWHRSANMDLLIALGVTSAFFAGVLSMFIPSLNAFHFHAAAMILIFINLGRTIETRAKRSACDAMTALAKRLPATAQRVNEQGVEEVPVAELKPGDRVRVAVDTVVPVDGLILNGQAEIDESSITGESVPRGFKTGDSVRSGGIVRDGLITIQTTQVGSASTLGRIIHAVEQAQTQKTDMQRIADRVAGVFVPIVIALAVITLVGWLIAPEPLARFLGDNISHTSLISHAARCAIAVLVIACPCAMGLATPTAVMVATGAAARIGILVRDGAVLERAGSVKTIFFDKTGTLTRGKPIVKKVLDDPIEPTTDGARQLLLLAASSERFCQHPFAHALVRKAKEWNLALMEPDKFSSKPGQGIEATVAGREVVVGSLSMLSEFGLHLDDAADTIANFVGAGQSVLAVAVDGHCSGFITMTDEIRPEALAALQTLSDMGVHPIMLTGDHAQTAAQVAAKLGIDEVQAEMVPEAKLARVQQLRETGTTVAFVGDGVNDGPALAAADVGITFASGTDVATGAAQITILHEDLRRVGDIIKLARRSVRIIKQNLFWAFFYNIVAIPLAATGHVPPGLAALAMTTSSISVVLNSLRIRRPDKQN